VGNIVKVERWYIYPRMISTIRDPSFCSHIRKKGDQEGVLLINWNWAENMRHTLAGGIAPKVRGDSLDNSSGNSKSWPHQVLT